MFFKYMKIKEVLIYVLFHSLYRLLYRLFVYSNQGSGSYGNKSEYINCIKMVPCSDIHMRLLIITFSIMYLHSIEVC